MKSVFCSGIPLDYTDQSANEHPAKPTLAFILNSMATALFTFILLYQTPSVLTTPILMRPASDS